MSNKEAIAKAPSGRVRRTPVSGRNVLTVNGKESGFEYRIVNDEGDRVQQFVEGGWEVVQAKDVKVGDRRVNAPSAEGSAAQVSVGGGKKAVLMRIQSDWYQEDQAAKQQTVDDLESSTKQKALNGTYGKLEITRE